MEYGVFLQPHVNWLLISFAIVSAMLCLVFFVAAVNAYHEYEGKKAVFGVEKSGPQSNEAIGWSILACVAFFAIWVLLGVGLAAGSNSQDSQGCWGENRTSGGIYQIKEAELVYHWEHLKDERGSLMYQLDINGKYIPRVGYEVYGPTTPDYFALELEGRPSSKNPDFKITHCVHIPYERVTENQTFIPSSKPEIQAVKISLPSFALKYADDWWKFKEANP